MFKGILIQKDDTGYYSKVAQIDEAVLPEGDVTVSVSHSTLNFKDALALTGKSPVVRKFPMIPGIDLVGTVESCTSGTFKPGDQVLLNGWGVGEMHCGGLAKKARLKSEWLIRLPAALTPRQAMIIGTAGYTAMLCIMALERQGVTPDKGDIVVTGANGGVGSFAVRLLAKLGYRVIASTGRPEESDYLLQLGAADIIDRATLSEPSRPLGKELWAGAIDSVGSHTLANVCAGLQYGGTVAACGLAQGMDFPASVAPFILRGITLMGIDSVMRPLADRVTAWDRLASLLTSDDIDAIGTDIGLDAVIPAAHKLLAGQIRGRLVVDLNRK